MQRLVNDPKNYVDEMLDGLYAASPDKVTFVDGDKRCLVSKYKKKGKVGLATGGGSGHLPLFLGYVGKGMLDGCSVGGVFQSPSPDQMMNVTRTWPKWRILRSVSWPLAMTFCQHQRTTRANAAV